MSLPPPGSNTPGPPPPPQGPPQGSPPPTGTPGYGPPPGYQNPPPGYQAFPNAPGGYGFAPANPATQFGRLAGFGTRLGGYLLDGLLYGLLFAVCLVPGVLLIVRAFDDCDRVRSGPNSTEIRCVGDQFDVGAMFGGLALIVIPAVIIFVVYLRALARTGQTWGRRIVGIKVIDEKTGTPPGWGKALGRSMFSMFISGQIFYIGYLWMIWDDKKQTLHDKVAGTHVIEA